MGKACSRFLDRQNVHSKWHRKCGNPDCCMDQFYGSSYTQRQQKPSRRSYVPCAYQECGPSCFLQPFEEPCCGIPLGCTSTCLPYPPFCGNKREIPPHLGPCRPCQPSIPPIACPPLTHIPCQPDPFPVPPPPITKPVNLIFIPPVVQPCGSTPGQCEEGGQDPKQPMILFNTCPGFACQQIDPYLILQQGTCGYPPRRGFVPSCTRSKGGSDNHNESEPLESDIYNQYYSGTEIETPKKLREKGGSDFPELKETTTSPNNISERPFRRLLATLNAYEQSEISSVAGMDTPIPMIFDPMVVLSYGIQPIEVRHAKQKASSGFTKIDVIPMNIAKEKTNIRSVERKSSKLSNFMKKPFTKLKRVLSLSKTPKESEHNVNPSSTNLEVYGSKPPSECENLNIIIKKDIYRDPTSSEIDITTDNLNSTKLEPITEIEKEELPQNVYTPETTNEFRTVPPKIQCDYTISANEAESINYIYKQFATEEKIKDKKGQPHFQSKSVQEFLPECDTLLVSVKKKLEEMNKKKEMKLAQQKIMEENDPQYEMTRVSKEASDKCNKEHAKNIEDITDNNLESINKESQLKQKEKEQKSFLDIDPNAEPISKVPFQPMVTYNTNATTNKKEIKVEQTEPQETIISFSINSESCPNEAVPVKVLEKTVALWTTNPGTQKKEDEEEEKSEKDTLQIPIICTEEVGLVQKWKSMGKN